MARRGKNGALNEREQRFVEEYIIDLNGAGAAARAGYSKKTARVRASQLLANANVAAAVDAALKARSERTKVTADRVLLEAQRLAFSDITQLFDEQGRFKRMSDWPEDARAAVAGIEFTKRNLTAGDGEQEDVVKVKHWDKSRPLEMLFKHLGLLTDKVDHSGEVAFRWLTDEESDEA